MRRCILSLAFVLVVSMATVRAERWYKLYDQAKDDINHQRWESAIQNLQQAVAQQPDSGASVRGEGTKRMAYFPYFLMGKANYHLGHYDEAARFFKQETRKGLTGRVATEMSLYQNYLRAIDEDRKRLAEFNQVVDQAHAARARGAFVEAADDLRRARTIHPAEFDRQNLGRMVDELATLEKNRVEEQTRRERETRFAALIEDASVHEKQGQLRDARQSLAEADRLISGRSEVMALRKRLKDREDRYLQLKQSALAQQIDGKLAQALQSLKQAADADLERFNSDKLAGVAASISRQIEIQNEIRARAQTVAAVQTTRTEDQIPKSRNPKPAPRSRSQAIQRVSVPDSDAMRRALVAAYEGPPDQAIRMLQEVQANSRTHNAEVESSIGIAYARLSFLTVNQTESERLREKATQHFRLALALDPGRKLNARLVAPQIIDLFAASK